MTHLQPRRDLWEHGYLPLHAVWPQLDGLHSLLQTHAKLLSKATATPAGQWIISPQDMASVMELTSTQQEIVCEVLGSVSVLNGTAPNRPPPGSEAIYVHELSLLAFLLLYSKESQSQRAENLEVWPEAGHVPTSFAMDGIMSPTRSMGVRTSLSGKAAVRQQLQQHLRHQTQQLRGLGEYLRRHLKTLVELCMDTPPSPSEADTTGLQAPTAQQQQQGQGQAAPQSQASQRLVKASEVDRLRFVLTPSHARQGGTISSLVPAFTAPSSAVPLDVVLSSLRHLWYEDTLQSPRVGPYSPAGSAKPIRHLGMVAPSGQVDETSVSGVLKGTVVRGESDLTQGTLRVTDCHDAIIYALAPLQTVYVAGCSDTVVVIGAAGQLVRVERCEKVTLIAAAVRVIVSSCHDCVLNLATPRPPLLIGDCRFVRLAPYNTRYERQLAHVAAVGMRLDCPNRWDSPLVLTPRERRLNSSSGGTPDSPRAGAGAGAASRGLLATTFSLLQPDELLPFVIPFQGSPGMLAGGPAPPHASSWKHMVPAVSRGNSAGGAPPDSAPVSAGGAAPGASGACLYLFPLPPEYERALHKKLTMTGELRNKFRQAALTKDREIELNNTIQAYFKEWLSSSSLLRQIYDLSNLERDRDDNNSTGNTGAPQALQDATATLNTNHQPTTTGPTAAKDKVMLSL